MQQPDVILLAQARIERRTVAAGSPLVVAPQPGFVALHSFASGAAVAMRGGPPFGPGSAAFATAGQPHVFRCTEEAKSTVFLFGRERLSAAADSALVTFGSHDLRGDPVASGVLAILTSLSHVRPAVGSADALRLEEVVIMQIEAIILVAQLCRDADGSSVGDLFGRLRERLQHDLSGDLDTWADDLGCPPSLLATALAAQGWTAGALRTEIRLQRYAAAIREGDETPEAEVVSALGFAGVLQATRAFRRRFGLTPRRYRLLTQP